MLERITLQVKKANPKLKKDNKDKNNKALINNNSNINSIQDNDILKDNKITKHNLSEKVIKEIKSTNGKTKIHIYDEELKICIKYTYKFKTPNNVFFNVINGLYAKANQNSI